MFMSDWPDAKIHSTALRYINQHAMDLPTWQYTLVGNAQPEVLSRAELKPGELPLVGFFLADASWYLLSTRRVLGSYADQNVDVAALDVHEDHFGNFKGIGGTKTELMKLRLTHGFEATLQYETRKASMAPIYYFRYWSIKYPVLGRLRA
jgi:hypothetical protein